MYMYAPEVPFVDVPKRNSLEEEITIVASMDELT